MPSRPFRLILLFYHSRTSVGSGQKAISLFIDLGCINSSKDVLQRSPMDTGSELYSERIKIALPDPLSSCQVVEMNVV